MQIPNQVCCLSKSSGGAPGVEGGGGGLSFHWAASLELASRVPSSSPREVCRVSARFLFFLPCWSLSALPTRAPLALPPSRAEEKACSLYVDVT